MVDPTIGDTNVQPKNLAARAGRWSATHRKTAILGWMLFVIAATLIGGKIGQTNLDDSAGGNGESKRGAMIMDGAGFPDEIGDVRFPVADPSSNIAIVFTSGSAHFANRGRNVSDLVAPRLTLLDRAA